MHISVGYVYRDENGEAIGHVDLQQFSGCNTERNQTYPQQLDIEIAFSLGEGAK